MATPIRRLLLLRRLLTGSTACTGPFRVDLGTNGRSYLRRVDRICGFPFASHPTLTQWDIPVTLRRRPPSRRANPAIGVLESQWEGGRCPG